MTRKDFELIAGTIAALDITLGEAGRKTVAELFGFQLARTNPRFNRQRFVTACLKD